MTDSAGEVTLLLTEMRSGRKDALERLLPLVYQELRRLAAHYMRDEHPGHTLQPTALVHEAFLRLAGQDRANWQNRAQFMGIAGQIMRHPDWTVEHHVADLEHEIDHALDLGYDVMVVRLWDLKQAELETATSTKPSAAVWTSCDESGSWA